MSLSEEMPRSDELLSSVRDFPRQTVMKETKGRTNFLSRVASNSIDIVLRELALCTLLNKAGEGDALRADLCRLLRDGTMNLDHPGLTDYLRRSVVTQIAMDQPKFPGYKLATDMASLG